MIAIYNLKKWHNEKKGSFFHRTESARIQHFNGWAEDLFIYVSIEARLAAQQIEPKLQKYIDGSLVQTCSVQ